MKAQLTKAVRRAAALPLAGRPIAMLAGLYRLPEYRNSLIFTSERLIESEEQLASTRAFAEEQVASARAFAEEQLPTLLDTISTMNHRQVALDALIENLVASIPVTIRNLARVQHEQTERLQEISGRVTDAAERIEALARATDAGESAAIQRLESQHTGIEQLHAEARSHAESIQFLLGRVEFVRRELMYELRYGASGPTTSEGVRAESKIVNESKVKSALETGLRLNLGAGHVPIENYVNVDRRALTGVDVVAEVDDLPFEPGSITEIYSAHLLEHFPQEQVRRTLLPMWLSLLVPGGRFTAIVPDGEAMIAAAANGTVSYEEFREVWFGGQDYDGDFHFNMFTPSSLEQDLKGAGFLNVEIVEAARKNGICYEFEISAIRPVAPKM